MAPKELLQLSKERLAKFMNENPGYEVIDFEGLCNLDSTTASTLIAESAHYVIGHGTMKAGEFGVQNYSQEDYCAYRNLLKLDLKPGQRANYAAKLKIENSVECEYTLTLTKQMAFLMQNL